MDMFLSLQCTGVKLWRSLGIGHCSAAQGTSSLTGIFDVTHGQFAAAVNSWELCRLLRDCR